MSLQTQPRNTESAILARLIQSQTETDRFIVETMQGPSPARIKS